VLDAVGRDGTAVADGDTAGDRGRRQGTRLAMLCTSGVSSSSVGTYAGQVVMAGFMNWHVPVAARRVVTMLPSLVILALAVDPSQALVYSQIVLSFGIPFALIPLLLISRDRAVMTDKVNRRLTNNLMLLTTIIITALNLGLLYGTITSLIA